MNYVGEDSTDPARISTLRVSPRYNFVYIFLDHVLATSRNVLVYRSDKKLRENRIEYCSSRFVNANGRKYLSRDTQNPSLPLCNDDEFSIERRDDVTDKIKNKIKRIVKTIRGRNDVHTHDYRGKFEGNSSDHRH